MTEHKSKSDTHEIEAKLNKLMPILNNMLQYSKEEKFCDVVLKAGKDGKGEIESAQLFLILYERHTWDYRLLWQNYIQNLSNFH